jgi:integrase/recombinase XerD
MLEHADLKTTQIHTRVAIRQLQEIQRVTHPTKLARDERQLRDVLLGDHQKEVRSKRELP